MSEFRKKLWKAIDNNDVLGAYLVIKHMQEQNPTYVDKHGIYGTTSLMYACQHNNPIFVEMLLDAGANLGGQDARGRTPLAHAIYSENMEIVNLLIGYGANVNVADYAGLTPLMYAIKQNRDTNIAKILIANGADITTKDNTGWSAIFYAAWRGEVSQCELLLEYVHNINEPDRNGRTPLMHAIAAGHTELSKLLITHSTLSMHRSNGEKRH